MIGRNIRKYRLIKDYKQEFMADKLGLSQQAYSNLERNSKDIGILLLIKIANILEIEVKELYSN